MSNCYTCKYRRNIPGDAHSACAHPKTGEAGNDPIGNLIAMFASVGRTEPMISEAAKELNIQAHSHGVKSGWFNWPWNFDPAWLQNCDGYEEETPKGKENV
jgi:hypothetical protein